MDSLSLGVIGGVSGIMLVAGGMKLYVLGYKHAMEYADQQLQTLKAQFGELRKVHERVGPPKEVPCVGWIALVRPEDSNPEDFKGLPFPSVEKVEKEEVEQLEGWWKVEGGDKGE